MLTARTTIQAPSPEGSAAPRRDATERAGPQAAAGHAFGDVSVHAPRLRSPVRLAREVAQLHFDGVQLTAANRGDFVSCEAFTSSSAPTPEGRFCVRREGEAQRLGGVKGAWGRVKAFFDPDSDIAPVRQDRRRWFLIEPQFPTSRSRMQIHYGIASEGCVTVRDSLCFRVVELMVEGGDVAQGTGYDGYPPGNDANVVREERPVDCVAWLDVSYGPSVSESAAPPPVRITAQEEMPLYRTLRPGYTGPDVKTLQQRLANENFVLFRPPVTGIYGPETEAAVIAFQTTNRLHVDGIAGPETIARLRALERR